MRVHQIHQISITSSDHDKRKWSAHRVYHCFILQKPLAKATRSELTSRSLSCWQGLGVLLNDSCSGSSSMPHYMFINESHFLE